MLTEDYIMRLINQALAVLLIALGLKKSGQYNEALQTYDQALGSLLGLDAHLAKQLDDSLLLEMLTFQGKVDMDRLLVVADIYREESEVYGLQGNPENSHFTAQRSLRLYLEAALVSEVNPTLELIQKIEGLRSKLDVATLPFETRLALLDYLDRMLTLGDDFLASAGLSRHDLLAASSSLDSPDLR
jgi:tetratricopeptide (TPR) repeat protein